MQKTRIIGIGGLPRSGKDTLAELFMQHGYYGVSFGDIVREFARQRHADKPDPISIANMTETSNWLRKKYGADVVLLEALKKFETAAAEHDYKGVVLFSVRAPIEVDFILERDGEVIWVEASDEVRYERNRRNRREGEPDISLEEFKRQETLQWEPQPGIPEKVQMKVSYVKEHATRTLANNGDDRDAFVRDGEALIARIEQD